MAVGRFQVMSILQAARSEALGLPEDSAYSWGLNRAIFYAAAKRGFKGGGAKSSIARESKRKAGEKEEEEVYYLGDEKAFVDEETSKRNRPYFTIGGETQTPKDFERQVISRFGSEPNFKKAWNEALNIIKEYDEETLKSQREFYERVYKPRRDDLAKKWTELATKKSAPAARAR